MLKVIYQVYRPLKNQCKKHQRHRLMTIQIMLPIGQIGQIRGETAFQNHPLKLLDKVVEIK